jgi:hypothetical protein
VAITLDAKAEGATHGFKLTDRNAAKLGISEVTGPKAMSGHSETSSVKSHRFRQAK